MTPEPATQSQPTHLDSPKLRSLRRALLTWYDRAKRDLPWRRRAGDGYAQWLAEMMLQQTQVATVIPYYQKFMKRFPTIADLAVADQADVLHLWAGLGYYARARNLHAAAQRVVDAYGAIVPDDVDELLTLPGVGRYTAGAIASIAYDVPAPIVDGNVTRVLARLLAIEQDVGDPQTQAQIWETSKRLLPKKRCGDFNQALMELGATICAPKQPRCLLCPWAKQCQAHRRGLESTLPIKRRRTAVKAIHISVAAVEKNGRYYWRQRPQTGLWAAMWELPNIETSPRAKPQAQTKNLEAELGLTELMQWRPVGRTDHQLTHRKIHFTIMRARLANGQSINANGQNNRWLSLSDAPKRLPISTAQQKILKLLDP
jgi:A/G-specific adenine glycosylase